MQNYKALWITVLGFCLLLLTSLVDFTFAEELTLTTYYPAPYGVYKEINLVPQSEDPTGDEDEGDLYYNSTEQEFKYYDGSSWQSVGGGGPANWECTVRSYSLGNLTSYNWVSVQCAEGEKAISGGCHYRNSVVPTLFYNYPYHPTHPTDPAITTQGWTCFAQAGGTYELTPIVNCCK